MSWRLTLKLVTESFNSALHTVLLVIIMLEIKEGYQQVNNMGQFYVEFNITTLGILRKQGKDK